MSGQHSPETVREALAHIPSDDRDTWMRMGMAVQSELGDAGFDVWNDWSQSSSSYRERDAKAAWRSFKEGGRITIGSLFYEAKQHGFQLNGHGKEITAAEWERIKQEREERQRIEAERKAMEEAAAAKLGAEILEHSRRATDEHPYLKRKGVHACVGLRVGKWYQIGDDGKRYREKDNCLLVPMRDADGTLWNVQAIFPENDAELERDKDYLRGGKKQGTYFAIGKPDDALVIAEGLATALSVHECTGYAVCVAFDKGNLLPVGRTLRAKLPSARVILAADNDIRDGKPNYGVEKAIEAGAELSAHVAIPHIDGRKADFNDLHKEQGRDAVKEAIARAALVPNKKKDEAKMKVATLRASDTTQEPQRLLVVTIENFLQRELRAREVLLKPWLLSQSLNMVYAWRGVGKTHFSMNVAYALSSGGKFMGWEADKPRKVLYVDGEMPGGALQKRLAEMVKANDKTPEPGMLHIITPDVQPDFLPVPDLATPEGQQALDDVIEATGAEIIFLDNLSCLVRGEGKENESESWLLVQGWALKHRAKGRSVVFIHHEGKSGAQRGTSRREDVLDTSIRLKLPPDYSPTEGACFEVHFEKARNLHGDQLSPIEAKLTEHDDKQVWTVSNLTESTYRRVIELANMGLRQSEIAIELQVNRSTVSRHYRRGKEEKKIKEGKE